jgi:hypothetical protein
MTFSDPPFISHHYSLVERVARVGLLPDALHTHTYSLPAKNDNAVQLLERDIAVRGQASLLQVYV